MKELLAAVEVLRRMDNDYDMIMHFLNKPEKHMDLFTLVLRDQITKYFDSNKPLNDLHVRYEGIMNLIHDNWWGNVYPVHDVHFHKSFENFVNCPFTCLTEVVDCLDKILEGKSQ